MTVTGKNHAVELDDEAERMRGLAEADVRLVLSPAILESAKAAIAIASQDGGRGLGEASADIEYLRTDPGLSVALDSAKLAKVVSANIARAMVAGFEVEAGFQTITTGVTFKMDGIPDLLTRYPVLGHQPAEIASHQASNWRYAVDGVLGQAVTSTAPIDLPAGIAETVDKAARDAGSAAAEAVAAGAQACRAAVGFGLQMRALNG